MYCRRLPVYDTDEGMALLHELARRRGTSAAALMRQLVREEAARTGIATEAAAPERQQAARERFRQLLEKARSGPAGDLTPEEIEREVTIARTEVRESRRAGRR
jgi:Ribbon-helix-helix protein, copG family